MEQPVISVPLSSLEQALLSNTGSPISVLPGELLGEIMIASTETDGCGPRQLAKVSRSWYSVAMSNPSLWSYISIESLVQGMKPDYPDRSSCPREICRSLGDLEQTLSRAKKALLSVCIICPHWDFRRPWNLSCVQFFQRLFGPDLTPQMSALEISDRGLLIPVELIDWPLCDFTSLRTLVVNRAVPSTERLLERVNDTALKLASVEFNNFSPGIDMLTRLDNLWPRLKRFRYPDFSTLPLDIVIPFCETLEFLCGGYTNWPTASTSSIPLAELNWAVLKCVSLEHFAKIHLPSLTTLELKQGSEWLGDNHPAKMIAEASNVAIYLPELRSLKLTASAAWLAAFHTPKLKDLTCQSGLSSEVWDDECLKFLTSKAIASDLPSFDSVESLYLATKASDSCIIDILPIFPNVSSFHLFSRYENPPKDFGRVVLEKLAIERTAHHGSGGGFLLPRLKALDWGGRRSVLHLEEGAVAQAARNLFMGRLESGLPFEEVNTYIVKKHGDWSGNEYKYTREWFTKSNTP